MAGFKRLSAVFAIRHCHSCKVLPHFADFEAGVNPQPDQIIERDEDTFMITAEQGFWCVYVWRANWIGVGRWRRLARCRTRERALESVGLVVATSAPLLGIQKPADLRMRIQAE